MTTFGRSKIETSEKVISRTYNHWYDVIVERSRIVGTQFPEPVEATNSCRVTEDVK
mgnify:CR=1 FL=1